MFRPKAECDQKVVTFFNFRPSTLIRYAGKILEPPTSVPIQLVTTRDGILNTEIVEATERKWTGFSLGSSQSESSDAYANALQISRTFVIADSYFSKDSFLVDSEGFLTHGLEPLKRFYELGGTVVVVCIEGIYAIGNPLESAFGCQWQIGEIDNYRCTPTDKGRELFGGDAVEKLYAGKGHFIQAPKEEGLYQVEVLDYETYQTEQYGLCPDEELSDDELNTCRQAYDHYAQRNANLFLLAVHENDKGGRIVWMGDRNQEDAKMRAIFAKVCCQEMAQPS